MDDLVADMEGLLTDTAFVPRVGALMRTLEEALGVPVDIEFAHDGKDFYLLQCRPQAQSGDAAPAPLPRDVAPADLIFNSAPVRFQRLGAGHHSCGVCGSGRSTARCPTPRPCAGWGRAVGHLNRQLP